MNYIKKFNKYDNSINEAHEAKLHQLISSVSSEKGLNDYLTKTMGSFIPDNDKGVEFMRAFIKFIESIKK
jgi:hypothetical protein